MQRLNDLVDRILPQHKGKRELLFVIALFVSIAGAGVIGGQAGWLHKDVPTSDATPTATITAPAPSATPPPG